MACNRRARVPQPAFPHRRFAPSRAGCVPSSRFARSVFARAFIAAPPAHTVWNGGRKVGAAGCIPSPRHELRLDLVYAASYGPIMVLGVLGTVWTRRCWREHALIYAAFLDCVVVTAVLRAHQPPVVPGCVLDRVRCARRVASGLGSIGPQMGYTFDGGKRFLGGLICEGETHEV
jgi:hypothetical protein